jgi:hypothetical protein
MGDTPVSNFQLRKFGSFYELAGILLNFQTFKKNKAFEIKIFKEFLRIFEIFSRFLGFWEVGIKISEKF